MGPDLWDWLLLRCFWQQHLFPFHSFPVVFWARTSHSRKADCHAQICTLPGPSNQKLEEPKKPKWGNSGISSSAARSQLLLGATQQQQWTILANLINFTLWSWCSSTPSIINVKTHNGWRTFEGGMGMCFIKITQFAVQTFLFWVSSGSASSSWWFPRLVTCWNTLLSMTLDSLFREQHRFSHLAQRDALL